MSGTIENGWFETIEMPKRTAALVLQEKEKKHIAQLRVLENGNCIVRFRGMTLAEKHDRQKREKLDRMYMEKQAKKTQAAGGKKNG